MSKHERQHSLSHVVHMNLSEAKRARVETTKDTSTNYSTDKLNCIRCSHQDNLNSLRTNILILLQKLFPQLTIYYPSTLTNDSSIDRLVANLIEIQAFYRPYPSI